MSDVLRVGFIGLGDQGAPMAVAIAEKYELHVWARRRSSYEALGHVPHIRASSPAELAASVDVLCLCLRSDADLHELLKDRSVFRELGRDKVIINHATGDPIECERFESLSEEWGVRFLDARVSGGRPGAEARSLTCFVGGRADAVETSRKIIECHSSSVIPMGPQVLGRWRSCATTP